MIAPIALGETIEFVLPEDKENPTIWILGPLDSITKTRLLSKLMPMEVEGETTKVSPATRIDALEFNINIVKFGLKGFKNFKDKAGKDIEFKTEKEILFNLEYDVVSIQTLKIIPMKVLNALASEILKGNSVTEEERKN